MTNTQEKETSNKQPKEQNQPEAWTEFAPVSRAQQAKEPLEAPEIRTRLPLPARPMVKGGFALALSGTVLVLVGIFFQLAGAFSWNNPNESAELQSKQPVAAGKQSSEMTAEEKLQWCLATRKCGSVIDPPLKKPISVAKVDKDATSRKEKQEAKLSQAKPQLSYNTVRDVEPPVQQVQPKRLETG